MSQRLADPIATQLERNFLGPLKDYFERRPFDYDEPYDDRSMMGRVFESYNRMIMSLFIQDSKKYSGYELSRVGPESHFIKRLIGGIRRDYFYAESSDRVLKVKSNGSVTIYQDGREVTEIDDFLEYRSPSIDRPSIPIIVESTVSPGGHGGSNVKTSNVWDMYGCKPFYLQVILGTPGRRTVTERIGPMKAKMFVSSV
jgi:hypothetical protein